MLRAHRGRQEAGLQIEERAGAADGARPVRGAGAPAPRPARTGGPGDTARPRARPAEAEAGRGAAGGEGTALVRVVVADGLLLLGLTLVAAGAVVRDVVTSARPGLELVLALVLGAAFGVFVHLRVHPPQRAAWPPSPPVPTGTAVAGAAAALPRAAAGTALAAALTGVGAALPAGAGLALVLVGAAVAVGLRVAAVVRWERERGRELLTPAGLRPLPRAFRSRPRL